MPPVPSRNQTKPTRLSSNEGHDDPFKCIHVRMRRRSKRAPSSEATYDELAPAPRGCGYRPAGVQRSNPSSQRRRPALARGGEGPSGVPQRGGDPNGPERRLRVCQTDRGPGLARGGEGAGGGYARVDVQLVALCVEGGRRVPRQPTRRRQGYDAGVMPTLNRDDT
jgi:hypothetical protein